MSKHIFITGGVTSSLGKGIIAASLAKVLQARGLRTTIQKFDPYINIDPGTLNPYEHGECYVTEDGTETDLDLGHYERFLNITTSSANNVTTGQIYKTVIERERRGDFLGKTVQVIPHITDEIKRRMRLLEELGDVDIIITEIGGTVGDLESLPYIEAIRQLKWGGEVDIVLIHLTYVPYLRAAGELKTKPTQHSVRALSENGVQPDVVVCRTEHSLTKEMREKIALFCNVQRNAVIEALDASTIYAVPLQILQEKLDLICLERLGITNYREPELSLWNEFLAQVKFPQHRVSIGLIGKYVELKDAYKSIFEAFVHAGACYGTEVEVICLQSDNLNAENVREKLADLHGVLVAPGFGERGIEGKIQAIRYVRESGRIPFLGICLGFQMACVEFARNVLGYADAASTEMQPETSTPIVHLMLQQKSVTERGGTMRLGAYACSLQEHTLLHECYGALQVYERHRHRYEFNNAYLSEFERAGFMAVGKNLQSNLVEIMQYSKHPFFVGVQFHPELKSTVENPHPLFKMFVKKALEYKASKQ